MIAGGVLLAGVIVIAVLKSDTDNKGVEESSKKKNVGRLEVLDGLRGTKSTKRNHANEKRA